MPSENTVSAGIGLPRLAFEIHIRALLKKMNGEGQTSREFL